jgi:hypothetical protein
MATSTIDVSDLLKQTAELRQMFNGLMQAQKDLPTKLLADWIDAKAKIDEIHAALVAQGWIKPTPTT